MYVAFINMEHNIMFVPFFSPPSCTGGVSAHGAEGSVPGGRLQSGAHVRGQGQPCPHRGADHVVQGGAAARRQEKVMFSKIRHFYASAPKKFVLESFCATVSWPLVCPL